jgi:SAM-dependent methyltransferase
MIEQERLSDSVPVVSWVRHEHLARFDFAAGFVNDAVVVDCACGTGIGASYLAAAGARQVHAFDLSADAIGQAARRERPNLKFSVASATDLGLPPASVDVYVCLETIEHVVEDMALLVEVSRVLRPSGVFICSTPNRWVKDPGATLRDRPCNIFHVREYSPAEFTDLLRMYFDQVSLFGQNPRRRLWLNIIARVGQVLPRCGAARLSQLGKLPWLLSDRKEKHAVRPLDSSREYEYLVAVCREPKAETSR